MSFEKPEVSADLLSKSNDPVVEADKLIKKSPSNLPLAASSNSNMLFYHQDAMTPESAIPNVQAEQPVADSSLLSCLK